MAIIVCLRRVRGNYLAVIMISIACLMRFCRHTRIPSRMDQLLLVNSCVGSRNGRTNRVLTGFTISMFIHLPCHRRPGTRFTTLTTLQVISVVRSEETRLNSSHGSISFAVFSLKKKSVVRSEETRLNSSHGSISYALI